MRITTIYDNYKTKEDLEIGWGFSCLIESDKKILFDAGEENKKIFSNMKKLGIDVKDIDILIISHMHWDHTGGLDRIRELNPNIKIYLPDAFSKPTEIIKDVYSTGVMESEPPEQAVVLKTDKGLVILTGCAHPGIVKIIKKARDFLKQDIYLVLGGFHLLHMGDNEVLGIIREFKNFGIKKAAPSHCTGDKAIELFRQGYGNGFVENSAGAIIEL